MLSKSILDLSIFNYIKMKFKVFLISYRIKILFLNLNMMDKEHKFTMKIKNYNFILEIQKIKIINLKTYIKIY